MDDLDLRWFEEQEQIEKSYDIYYKAPVEYIWVSLMYVNNNELEYIKKEKVVLNKGTLSKNSIVNYINTNRKLNAITYKLHALSMFNITITPEQILEFDYTDNYFKDIQHIADVVYEDTISYLSDVNELFIILTPRKNNSTTKKINIIRRKQTRRNL